MQRFDKMLHVFCNGEKNVRVWAHVFFFASDITCARLCRYEVFLNLKCV